MVGRLLSNCTRCSIKHTHCSVTTHIYTVCYTTGQLSDPTRCKHGLLESANSESQSRTAPPHKITPFLDVHVHVYTYHSKITPFLPIIHKLTPFLSITQKITPLSTYHSQNTPLLPFYLSLIKYKIYMDMYIHVYVHVCAHMYNYGITNSSL